MGYSFSQIRKSQKKYKGYSGDFFESIFYRKLSKHLTLVLAKTGLKPVQIVFIGFLIGIVSALFFLSNNYWFMIIGIFFLHLSKTLDCVDGEIARLKNQITSYGRWLDYTFDCLLELVIYSVLFFISINKSEIFIIFGFASIIATSMMYFSSAWSVVVIPDAIKKNLFLKKDAQKKMEKSFQLSHINSNFFSYDSGMRYMILTLFIITGIPEFFLVFHGILGNIYWGIRIWIYRKEK